VRGVEGTVTSFDPAELARRYAEQETDELLRIGYAQSDEYLPEAVALARAELRRRGVEGEADERVAVAREDEAARRQLAEEPLDFGVKVVCFVMPFIVGWICSRQYAEQGKRRAAEQAWACTLAGWVTRTALIIAAVIFFRM
jgi:hypothetical protein